MEYMNLVNVVFTIRHAILELEERITTEASQPRVRARTVRHKFVFALKLYRMLYPLKQFFCFLRNFTRLPKEC